jgi:hypothetical protein
MINYPSSYNEPNYKEPKFACVAEEWDREHGKWVQFGDVLPCEDESDGLELAMSKIDIEELPHGLYRVAVYSVSYDEDKLADYDFVQDKQFKIEKSLVYI